MSVLNLLAILWNPTKEINGLTFGGVGSGTEVEFVQVSYSNDDSYEWFGGTVNAKHLVAYKGWDDDFDTDYDYTGNLQFLLVCVTRTSLILPTLTASNPIMMQVVLPIPAYEACLLQRDFDRSVLWKGF